MSQSLARQAGAALIWRGVRLVGIKVIFLVRMLVLARLLVPDDFGLLAVSLIIVDLLTSITNFGMIPALVQRPEATEREYDTAWTVDLVRAFSVAAIVFLTAPLVADLLSEPRAIPLIRVIALRPLIEAAASIKVAALIRDLRFRSLAFVQLPDALANATVSILCAPLFGVWALIAGALAGKLTYLALSYLYAPHRPRLVLDARAARPLIRFGRWVFVVGVVAVASRSVLQGVISRRLGTAELGLYYLAARLAFIPYELTSEVVGTVAFPLYVRLREERDRAASAFRSILRGVSALVIPICLLMSALAPSLAEDLLGEHWRETAPLIRILVLVSLPGLLADVATPFFHGIGQPRKHALVEIVQAGLLIAAVWTLTIPFGVAGAAFAWVVAVSAAQVVVVKQLEPEMPHWFQSLPMPLAAIMSASLLGAVVGWAVDAWLGGLEGLVTGVLLGSGLTGGLLWSLDRRLSLGLTNDLAKAFPQIGRLLRVSPGSD